MGNSADTLIKNVRRLMAEHGWTAADLARKMGKKPPQISDYLNKVSVPQIAVLEEMARALGVPVWELLYDGTPPTPPEPTTAQAFERVRAALADLIANGLDSPGTKRLTKSEIKQTRQFTKIMRHSFFVAIRC